MFGVTHSGRFEYGSSAFVGNVWKVFYYGMQQTERRPSTDQRPPRKQTLMMS